jgi:hypothetical protein
MRMLQGPHQSADASRGKHLRPLEPSPPRPPRRLPSLACLSSNSPSLDLPTRGTYPHRAAASLDNDSPAQRAHPGASRLAGTAGAQQESSCARVVTQQGSHAQQGQTHDEWGGSTEPVVTSVGGNSWQAQRTGAQQAQQAGG